MVYYQTPTAPTLPNPVGLDSEIQKLQLLLAERLGWLQVSYGKAYRHSEKRNGKTLTLPKVYAGESEYRDVLPNDNVAAQSFFLPRDPASVSEAQEPMMGTLPLVQTVDYIVWGNLTRIDETKAYRFEAELQRDVLRVLNGAGVLVQRVFTTPEEVFRGFSVELIPEHVLRHPYAGFRIQLELSTANVLC
ncbi:hypothetical protein [Hymenobacter sediminicola]|uniref:Uncharacterized protein n=1 Tax=Hymenobacter sediminicola TaxID=2761579 RepID=A0A7G7W305_9BACT|nr:hypothetical protein [Hymenobacter sediminicola]QNH60748.1 hypothetical protein H4317_11150 [Hymenobacter sediminicola]